MIGGHGTVEVGMRGHDDHGQIRIARVDHLQQLQSIHPRHADVRHDHVGLLAFEGTDYLLRTLETGNIHFRLLQGLLQNPANRPIIIDDPDST